MHTRHAMLNKLLMVLKCHAARVRPQESELFERLQIVGATLSVTKNCPKTNLFGSIFFTQAKPGWLLADELVLLDPCVLTGGRC